MEQLKSPAHSTIRPRVEETEPNGLTLYAVGFNGHNQLTANGGNDVPTFIPIQPHEHSGSHSVRLLHSGWGYTALVTDSTLFSLGIPELTHHLSPEQASGLHSGHGDHHGFHGYISAAGHLYTTNPDTGELNRQGDDDSPRLGHLALADNGTVAVTFKQAPNGGLAHVLQLPSLADLWRWYDSPSIYTLDGESQHFMLPGRPKQLVAGTGTFTLLMEGGEVYTWGDPRYRSLGREISEVPAEHPALVEALGGLKIVKVAAGGWMGAAVSEDRAGYVWGTGEIGAERTMTPLKGSEDVRLVEIEGGVDVLDIGVGVGHLLAVVEGGRLFGVGANRNGQLGLGGVSPQLLDDWTEVPGVRDIRSVVCGPQASFIYRDPHER